MPTHPIPASTGTSPQEPIILLRRIAMCGSTHLRALMHAFAARLAPPVRDPIAEEARDPFLFTTCAKAPGGMTPAKRQMIAAGKTSKMALRYGPTTTIRGKKSRRRPRTVMRRVDADWAVVACDHLLALVRFRPWSGNGRGSRPAAGGGGG